MQNSRNPEIHTAECTEESLEQRGDYLRVKQTGAELNGASDEFFCILI